MIKAVRESTEPGHLKKEAIRYLTGVKGTLVQKKKREAEREAEKAKAAAENRGMTNDSNGAAVAATNGGGHVPKHANGAADAPQPAQSTLAASHNGNSAHAAPLPPTSRATPAQTSHAGRGSDPRYMQQWALGGLGR